MKIKTTIKTIILAAGSSGRFGCHKALFRYGQISAIRRVIDASLSSESNQTIVVLGAEAESIRREIGDMPVEIIQNKQFLLGRTESLKCALRCLGEPPTTAVLIFPVDCPFVPSRVLDKLIECYRGQPDKESVSYWVTPEYHGRRGHPVLLAGPVLSRILELADNFPLRDFLHKLAGRGNLRHITVSVDTESVLDNINTVKDLRQSLKREALA